MNLTIQFKSINDFIKSLYPGLDPVPLHAPVFLGNEKDYLMDCIDSTFVSYVGKYVTRFEQITAEYTGAKFAVAVVNGTAALHIALKVAGVQYGDEVITQSLTFVATANAISHCGAIPVFIDVDMDTMGMSPEKLNTWLNENVKFDPVSGKHINKTTNRPVTAIVPMHTFGHPCRIDEIVGIASGFNIPVIEDSAESLGSYYKDQHTGTFGLAGILSYNGNKSVTTGGGGMIITNDEELAKKAKHITTTAKLPHKWEFIHDQIAYNYRLTNLNAAIGLAQMEYYDRILINKRETAEFYKNFFEKIDIEFFTERLNSRSNYWLNVIQFNDLEQRNLFLNYSNDNGIITRPVWKLMNKLDMYKDCQTGNLENSFALESCVVNLPSSYRQ